MSRPDTPDERHELIGVRRKGARALMRGGRRALLFERRLRQHATSLATAPVKGMRLVARRSHTVGRVPGDLGEDQGGPPAAADVLAYDTDRLAEVDGVPIADALGRFEQAEGTRWLNVDGAEDVRTIGALGRALDLHPLIQEDLVQTTQRPKAERYGDALFVVVRMVTPPAGDPETLGGAMCVSEQVGFVLGYQGDGAADERGAARPYLLTVQEQEQPGDVFDPVRERIRRSSGQIRRQGPGYLLYALLDVVVDHYLAAAEALGDRVEVLEDLAMREPSNDLQAALTRTHRELVIVRKAVLPMRDVLQQLIATDHPLLSDRTKLYLRDALDHANQAADALDGLREVLARTFDLYVAAVGMRQNEVMKVLTIVGAIFLPLTFIAGLYGMNFAYIPELQYRYGYFIAVGAMVAIAVGALTFFRRKGWL
jgi:magnesium transporter